MLAVANQGDLIPPAVKQVNAAPSLPQKTKEVGYSAVDQETTLTVTNAVATVKLTAVASPKAVDLAATAALRNVAHVAKLRILAREQRKEVEANLSKVT